MILELEKFIVEKLRKKPQMHIEADEPLLSSGLVDSFHIMDLALFVEDTYGVALENTELNAQTFDSLTGLAELIRSRQK